MSVMREEYDKYFILLEYRFRFRIFENIKMKNTKRYIFYERETPFLVLQIQILFIQRYMLTDDFQNDTNCRLSFNGTLVNLQTLKARILCWKIDCNSVTGSAHTCRIVLRSVLCLFSDFKVHRQPSWFIF